MTGPTPGATAGQKSSLSENKDMEKPNAAIVSGKTLKDIIWNPVVYLPFTGIAIANAALPVPAWMNIPAVVAVVVGQILYWKRNWDFMYRKHESEEEVVYRKFQNAGMAARIDSVREQAWTPGLFRAMELKSEIERRIFADGCIFPKERELLDIIGSTVEQMIAEADSTGNNRPSREFTEALQTLEELNNNFDFVTRPLSPTEEEKKHLIENGLAESVKTLKNRMEEATQIRRIVNETKEKNRT
jgi:hypothetical protein